MLGRVTRQKVCQPDAPSVSAASSSDAALRDHQRDQLAGDEREGDEDRRQDEPGKREDDLDIALLEPLAEPALGAEQQHEHQARDRPARPRTAGRSG